MNTLFVEFGANHPPAFRKESVASLRLYLEGVGVKKGAPQPSILSLVRGSDGGYYWRISFVADADKPSLLKELQRLGLAVVPSPSVELHYSPYAKDLKRAVRFMPDPTAEGSPFLPPPLSF